jgi:hypothetical protein
MDGWAESASLVAEMAHLLGGATVFRPRRQPMRGGQATRTSRNNEIVATLQMPPGTRPDETFVLTRRRRPFSDFEIRLCDEIARGASALWHSFDAGGRLGHIRTAVNESALTVGVARLLRSQSSSFWSVSTLITLFKGLTFYTYENKPCTSGIICLQGTSEEARSYFMPSVLPGWRYQPLPHATVIDERFFNSVGSYRYVDGIAKYYVARIRNTADEPAHVIGTIELRNRNGLSLSQMASYDHLHELLLLSPVCRRHLAHERMSGRGGDAIECGPSRLERGSVGIRLSATVSC